MRFRKRVSLGGGMHLNLSKSGVSMTGGMKGLSVNVGKKGTYLNTGIPGTGLYNRTKIGGGSKRNNSTRSSRASSIASSPGPSYETTRVQVELTYNDDGTVTFKDSNGSLITNPDLLRQIKASPQYKAELDRMTKDRMSQYDERMESIINIQSLTPKVRTTAQYRQKIQSLTPQQYTPRAFPEQQPSMEDVIADLMEEAMRTIEVRSKRKKSKLCDRYVNDTKESEYSKRFGEWQVRRDAFLEKEKEEEKRFNEEEKERLEKRQQQMLRLVEGDAVLTDKAIQEWLATVKFDFDFNLDYEFDGEYLFVDLDLPEIEDLPETKAQKMANGIAKIKPKTKKEIKEDYSKCVFGLAVFFAGNIFNKALNTQNIIVSGYTQRRNKNGDIVDDYIYSILFDRNTFRTIDYDNNDPRSNCMMFKNRVLQNADQSFKAITPYSFEDIQEEE